MDLKDAYFPLPIKQEDWKRDKETYKFTCFFLDATRMFTKIIKPVVDWMRQFGCQIITKIDNNCY